MEAGTQGRGAATKRLILVFTLLSLVCAAISQQGNQEAASPSSRPDKAIYIKNGSVGASPGPLHQLNETEIEAGHHEGKEEGKESSEEKEWGREKMEREGEWRKGDKSGEGSEEFDKEQKGKNKSEGKQKNGRGRGRGRRSQN